MYARSEPTIILFFVKPLGLVFEELMSGLICLGFAYYYFLHKLYMYLALELFFYGLVWLAVRHSQAKYFNFTLIIGE